jgi:RimJ/RimL family protein N-acetyltransferase
MADCRLVCKKAIFIPMIHMQGKRVVLRDWKMEDLPVLRHWHTGEQDWKRWDGPYFSAMTEEEREKWLENMAESIEAEEFPMPRRGLCIADRETDQLLGGVSSYWQSKETWWLSVGITLFDPEVRGKGVGYEALGMWCEYLFCAMEVLPRLDLRTWSGNEGMIRLAKKLGFREEARFRKARIVEGKYYDGMGYGVLREEWEAKYPQGFS